MIEDGGKPRAESGSPDPGGVFQLRNGGVGLVLDARGPGLPVVLHWGCDLGELTGADLVALAEAAVPAIPSNSIDEPRRVGLLPQPATGYAGRAGLVGSRADGVWSPVFRPTRLERSTTGDGTARLVVEAADEASGLQLETRVELTPAGVARLRHALRNVAATPYELLRLPAVLPVPARAGELLDLTGRHLKERVPQRMPFNFGSWVREQRRGRTGHDAPLILAAGTPGFGFRHGEVWAVHVAWSGDSVTFAERLPEGWSCVGGGEVLQPTEVVLGPGESYEAPWVWAAWSPAGLDGVSDALHATLRARPGHPRTPRPVVLNTWEAVYFDHDLNRLTRLADIAAAAGVERFVLDDGWFGGRRDDTAGLGDWFVSPDVWPEGLHPLVRHVTGLGLEFGLWVEPEMVNPDSDLARAHPDWLLTLPGRPPPPARQQHVLDVAQPAVTAYLLERLGTLLTDYPIGYLKWDHNRDLMDATHAGPNGPRPGVHAQTAAVYALLDELRRLHPRVEIESCAGGGGRVDLGILARTDRIWTSDSNDPLERQQIQRYTSLLVPPELMGAHVGPAEAHTTGRVSRLAMRAGTALFGHFGVEWNLVEASPAELGELAAWISVYRRFRGLLHTGRVVRPDPDDPSSLQHGVVAPDGSEALFAHVQLTTSGYTPPPPVRLPGLLPAALYAVEPVRVGEPPMTTGAAPPWLTAGTRLPGSVLAEVGLPAPLLGPEQLVLLHVTRLHARS
jgi:alpha-galactosidase